MAPSHTTHFLGPRRLPGPGSPHPTTPGPTQVSALGRCREQVCVSARPREGCPKGVPGPGRSLGVAGKLPMPVDIIQGLCTPRPPPKGLTACRSAHV